MDQRGYFYSCFKGTRLKPKEGIYGVLPIHRNVQRVSSYSMLEDPEEFPNCYSSDSSILSCSSVARKRCLEHRVLLPSVARCCHHCLSYSKSIPAMEYGKHSRPSGLFSVQQQREGTFFLSNPADQRLQEIRQS